MVQRLLNNAERLVLQSLAALVAHDRLLRGKVSLVELVEQIAHAIGLQPQRQLELVGWERLEVIGAVKTGRGVEVARAGALEVADMLVGAHVS